MKHHCHIPDCNTVVPPRLLMCARHWRMVPKAQQGSVGLYYRPGQENDKNPSVEYLRAARAAIAAVQDFERHHCRTCGVDLRAGDHRLDCKSRVLGLPGLGGEA
jgi:hypothetical protein